MLPCQSTLSRSPVKNVGAPSAGGVNSAWRLRAVHDAFALDPALAERVAQCPGPILLVDDLVDSGWTMTVAARLLRQAGARIAGCEVRDNGDGQEEQYRAEERRNPQPVT